MLDQPATLVSPLSELREKFAAAPPTLPEIFSAGERISATHPLETDPTQRIAVLGAATIDFICRAVSFAVVREGVFPQIYQSPFGSYIQEVLDPASGCNAFEPELVVIAPTARELIEPIPISTAEADVNVALDAKVALFQSLWTPLASKKIAIVQHLLVPPANRYCGIAERLAPAAPINQIQLLNTKLLEAGRGVVHWIDMDALADRIGSRNWSGGRSYYTAKLDFELRWLPDYVSLFRSAWRAANARTKKVLAVDLDNTLWGGVIGDDGVEGITLGPGSPTGEAFVDWQRYLKGLAERGVILAVCSKNTPEIAGTGLTHPNSALKHEDFAAFECSWNDKAGGLRRIAKELNVGLDSIVFVDDNPAECDLIRRELPEVATVHLGTDPTQFVNLLDNGHWFDLYHYTREDLGRSAAYTARRAALDAEAQATDVASYLTSLDMKGHLYRPDEIDIPRVAQLEQKTNQFNLTTRRYSEAAIREFLARPEAIVLAFRLVDRFGDHGLVSTLIALQEGDELRIDSWLMSCRVFSRSTEQYIVRELIELARARGAKALIGEYMGTVKNQVVAELYDRLGFTKVEPNATWQLRIDAPTLPEIVTYIASA